LERDKQLRMSIWGSVWVFSLLGFSTVGTNLGKAFVPDSTHPGQAHRMTQGLTPLADAHAQPPRLLLKQQVIAACTRPVAKMRSADVNQLLGKTYSVDTPVGSWCLLAGYAEAHGSLSYCLCALHMKLLHIPLLRAAELYLL